MEKKQKRIVLFAIIIIIATIIFWLLSGAEIFTKTQILVEKKDELFGWTEKQWINKFIVGLDLILVIDLVLVLATTFLIFILRRKSK